MGCSQGSATLDFVVTTLLQSGAEQDELAVLGEGRGVQVVLDVQSVLGEDRADQVVLRVVVGCEREGAARTNMAMNMDDLNADSFTRAKMTLQLTHA